MSSIAAKIQIKGGSGGVRDLNKMNIKEPVELVDLNQETINVQRTKATPR